MKHTTSLTGKALLMFCFVMVCGLATFAHSRINPSGNDYESSTLKIQLQLPEEWQVKVKVEESADQLIFKYQNPGGEPVFIMSITRIDEQQWSVIKEQVTGAKLLCHKDGKIIYAEKTDKLRLKGANNQEYNAIISKIDEVLKSFKQM